MSRSPKAWIFGGIAALLLAFVVAPFIYTQFVASDAPEELSVGTAPPSAAAEPTRNEVRALSPRMRIAIAPTGMATP